MNDVVIIDGVLQYNKNIKHIVSVGGGISSTILLPLVLLHVLKIPKEEVVFVIAELPNEHKDLFKLLEKSEEFFGIEIHRIGKNLAPYDYFMQDGFWGNSRYDSCSKMLKRRVFRTFVKKYKRKGVNLHFGIKANEIDRTMSIIKAHKDRFNVKMPLLEYDIDREFELYACELIAGFVPEMYRFGFNHHNCHGACVKGGNRHWERLLYYYPDVYKTWEEKEEQFNTKHNKQQGCIIIQKKKVKYILTLKQYRKYLQNVKWSKKPPVFETEQETGCISCSVV